MMLKVTYVKNDTTWKIMFVVLNNIKNLYLELSRLKF